MVACVSHLKPVKICCKAKETFDKERFPLVVTGND